MGVNTFNLENADRLKHANEQVATIPTEASKGIQAGVEMANDSQVGKLIAAAGQMEEKGASFFKTCEEFNAAADKLQAYYKNMSEQFE